MPRSSLCSVLACFIAIIAVALLSSCGDDPCEPADEADYSRDTPENLLNHMAESFNHQRLDWYDDCLDESFTFVLTDEDADSLRLPEEEPWLERFEDTTAVGRMFRHENVKRVRFDFVAIDPLVAGVEEGTFVYRTTPDILVEIDCGDGEPIAYVVQDTWLELTVGEDPGNGDLWVILDMEEIHKSPGLTDALGSAGPAAGGLLATATSTLGSIKSMFIVASEEDRTADMALEDYMAAVASEDIALYSDCLDFDHRYIFTDDVADSLHLPPEAPWWGKSEDLEVMTIMFGHPHVTRIDFDYVSLSSDTTWVGGNKIVRTRVRPDILLRLESPGEEPWHFVVQDVFMDFAFVRRGCCLETWTLLSVEEIPMNPGRSKNAGLALTEATSWGEVKAMFVP